MKKRDREKNIRDRDRIVSIIEKETQRQIKQERQIQSCLHKSEKER